MNRTIALLWDVQNAIDDVNVFLKGHSKSTFLENALLQAAVERKLQIIGEALAVLSKVDPDMAAKISDIRQIIGFRNVLVHGYAVVEHSTVYEIAIQKLPGLEAEINSLRMET